MSREFQSCRDIGGKATDEDVQLWTQIHSDLSMLWRSHGQKVNTSVQCMLETAELWVRKSL